MEIERPDDIWLFGHLALGRELDYINNVLARMPLHESKGQSEAPRGRTRRYCKAVTA